MDHAVENTHIILTDTETIGQAMAAYGVKHVGPGVTFTGPAGTTHHLTDVQLKAGNLDEIFRKEVAEDAAATRAASEIHQFQSHGSWNDWGTGFWNGLGEDHGNAHDALQGTTMSYDLGHWIGDGVEALMNISLTF